MRKRRQKIKITKKHTSQFSTFCIQRFIEIFIEVTQTTVSEYIAHLWWQTSFFKDIKCVFWFFIGFTTAMNMISGLNWGKASFLIFFKILFLFLFFARLDNQWNQITDKLMMISKAKLFRVEKKGYLEISDSGVLGLLLFENSNYVMIAEKNWSELIFFWGNRRDPFLG